MIKHPLSPAQAANWRASLRLLTLLVLLALASSALTQPAQASPESRVLPQLRREAEQHPDKKFRVIVSRLGGNRIADRALGVGGGAKLKDLFTDAFVAELPGRAIEALGRNPAVKFISYDAPMINTGSVDGGRVTTIYPAAVNVSSLWTTWTGAGVGVAVVDSGINKDLPDWRSKSGVTRIPVRQLFNTWASESALDAYAHGTHVAGVIAGNSWYRQEPGLKGKYIGIAPEANLIDVKVTDNNGISYTSDVVNAIEWVIKERRTYNIRVMNLSMVQSVPESARTSILAAAVERAWFNGILVVVSAGNLGPNSMYYPPANDPFVITVGAADAMGTTTRSDDTVALWSSYGLTQDGFSKPEVVAPGRHIVAPLASSTSVLAKLYPERIVEKHYLRMSGTSMAAPMVSGIAALAIEAHPEWTNDQIKWLLQHTATELSSVSGSPWPGQGAGLVDAAAVVNYAGTPGFANQGLTINEQLTTSDGTTSYSSANWSTANWSTANWSTANWSTANWSTANWSTANQQDVE